MKAKPQKDRKRTTPKTMTRMKTTGLAPGVLALRILAVLGTIPLGQKSRLIGDRLCLSVVSMARALEARGTVGRRIFGLSSAGRGANECRAVGVIGMAAERMDTGGLHVWEHPSQKGSGMAATQEQKYTV